MINAQALSSIENMLSQMRAVTRAAQGLPAQSATQPAAVSGGFAAELARSLNRVSEAQNASAGQARAFALGDPGVSLNNVMIDMQKANLAFQGTVQVRNRLIDAYKEIANMAV